MVAMVGKLGERCGSRWNKEGSKMVFCCYSYTFRVAHCESGSKIWNVHMSENCPVVPVGTFLVVTVSPCIAT